MDENFKAKANPNVVVVLDYLAVGAILGLYFYIAIIAQMVSADSFANILLGLLAGLGVYKIQSYGGGTTTPPTDLNPAVALKIVPQPKI